jgi:hypothetical protein
MPDDCVRERERRGGKNRWKEGRLRKSPD